MRLQTRLMLWLFVCCALTITAQDTPLPFDLSSSPDPAEAAWVDAVFQAMSPDQRLGQLFMGRAHSDLGPEHIAEVEALIRDYHIGGLCFFQGTPEKQVELINRYQTLNAHVPLMMAVDGEWGLGMRFPKSTISFPRQLTLGAISDNSLIYDMGKEIASQLQQTGIHVNFAPVADVNNNPANPVINNRSFGEDRYNVTAKSFMYMNGLQDHGILACAKHFPGHGDTDVDSHYDLPVIKHDRARLDSIELYPFRALTDQGVGSMMVAHVAIPSLDDRPNRPTTLSKATVTDLLRDELNFKGLIFTDGLEMKGVTKHFRSGQVEAEALVAGNDILLLPEDYAAAFAEIKTYLADGRLQQADLDEKCKRVLRSKYRLGLTDFRPLPLGNLRARLNNPEALKLQRKLAAKALTLVRNKDNLFPLEDVRGLKLASISLGSNVQTVFQKRLLDYADFTNIRAPKNFTAEQHQRLLKRLEDNDLVIVSLHDMSKYASKEFGITADQRAFIAELAQKTKVALVVFGSPYSLTYFDDIEWALMAYEENGYTQDLAAQALFGAIGISGKLPVTASPRSTYNTGVTTKASLRMGFAPPAQKGFERDSLHQIEAIMQAAIKDKATPGGVVLVAKDGQIVYHEAFGHHTYSRRRVVRKNDVFDLASITKVASATLAIMHLYEQGKVGLDAPLSTYLPELAGTDKAGLTLRSILAHRAGLRSWIPFYTETITSSRRNPQPMTKFYRRQLMTDFQIPVTEKLFLADSYRDTIWQRLQDLPLRSRTNYRYSDIGFYFIAEVVERVSKQSLDAYLNEHFYKPMGLRTTGFNPAGRLPLSRIVPTEEDNYFRRQRVHGYVHDMGAAMLGGVSGHAGLFSNAPDLATIFQMFLQEGYYGGRQYLQPETVRLFTARYADETRRGLGFDLRQLNPAMKQNMSPLASESAYGHLGFTGTCVWTDPEHDLIYIFLSNRTYPSMKNYKLSRDNYRPQIQSVIYEAMGVQPDSTLVNNDG